MKFLTNKSFRRPEIPWIVESRPNLTGEQRPEWDLFSDEALLTLNLEYKSPTFGDYQSATDEGYSGNESGDSIIEEVAPRLVFEDLFTTENGGFVGFNWTAFAKWDVTAGGVDLHHLGDFGSFSPTTLLSASGLFVDLVGTDVSEGEISLKPSLAILLKLGKTYLLSFDLAGNNRAVLGGVASNTVQLTWGMQAPETIVVPREQQMTSYSREFTPNEDQLAILKFKGTTSGSNIGPLLDNVRILEL